MKSPPRCLLWAVFLWAVFYTARAQPCDVTTEVSGTVVSGPVLTGAFTTTNPYCASTDPNTSWGESTQPPEIGTCSPPSNNISPFYSFYDADLTVCDAAPGLPDPLINVMELSCGSSESLISATYQFDNQQGTFLCSGSPGLRAETYPGSFASCSTVADCPVLNNTAPESQCVREVFCGSGSLQCEYSLKHPGSPCDDFNPCTVDDRCGAGGICIGRPESTCQELYGSPCRDAICVSNPDPSNPSFIGNCYVTDVLKYGKQCGNIADCDATNQQPGVCTTLGCVRHTSPTTGFPEIPSGADDIQPKPVVGTIDCFSGNLDCVLDNNFEGCSGSTCLARDCPDDQTVATCVAGGYTFRDSTWGGSLPSQGAYFGGDGALAPLLAPLPWQEISRLADGDPTSGLMIGTNQYLAIKDYVSYQHFGNNLASVGWQRRLPLSPKSFQYAHASFDLKIQCPGTESSSFPVTSCTLQVELSRDNVNFIPVMCVTKWSTAFGFGVEPAFNCYNNYPEIGPDYEYPQGAFAFANNAVFPTLTVRLTEFMSDKLTVRFSFRQQNVDASGDSFNNNLLTGANFEISKFTVEAGASCELGPLASQAGLYGVCAEEECQFVGGNQECSNVLGVCYPSYQPEAIQLVRCLDESNPCVINGPGCSKTVSTAANCNALGMPTNCFQSPTYVAVNELDGSVTNDGYDYSEGSLSLDLLPWTEIGDDGVSTSGRAQFRNNRLEYQTNVDVPSLGDGFVRFFPINATVFWYAEVQINISVEDLDVTIEAHPDGLINSPPSESILVSRLSGLNQYSLILEGESLSSTLAISFRVSQTVCNTAGPCRFSVNIVNVTLASRCFDTQADQCLRSAECAEFETSTQPCTTLFEPEETCPELECQQTVCNAATGDCVYNDEPSGTSCTPPCFNSDPALNTCPTELGTEGDALCGTPECDGSGSCTTGSALTTDQCPQMAMDPCAAFNRRICNGNGGCMFASDLPADLTTIPLAALDCTPLTPFDACSQGSCQGPSGGDGVYYSSLPVTCQPRISDSCAAQADPPCVEVTCDSGNCVETINTGIPCPFNEADDGTCLPDGSCGLQDPACDDSNQCTGDFEVTSSPLTCDNIPLNGGPCEVNMCQVNCTCSAGVCGSCDTVVCDDNNDCTADSCDPVEGCVHTPIPGQACLGALYTQTESFFNASFTGYNLDSPTLNPLCATPAQNSVCSADGVCVGTSLFEPVPFDFPCVIYQQPCVSQQACNANCNEQVNNGLVLNDGIPCDGGNGICSEGKCCLEVGGECGTPCVDSPCTLQRLEGGVCVDYPRDNTTTCDDGSACTLDDHCDGMGACVGEPIDVREICPPQSNTCLRYECDQDVQCKLVSRNNGEHCFDGDLCTQNDQCVNGECVGSDHLCNQLPVQVTSDFETTDCTSEVVGYGGGIGTMPAVWTVVDQEYAIATTTEDGGQARVFDLIDPSHPVLLPTLVALDAEANHCEARGSILFCVTKAASIYAIDIFTPESLSIVSSLSVASPDMPTLYDLALSHSGNTLYTGGPQGTSVLVIDISNPAAMVQVTDVCGSILFKGDCTTTGIVVKGDTLFTINRFLQELWYYNISSEQAPTFTGNVMFPGSNFIAPNNLNFAPDDDYLLMTDAISTWVGVVDISDASLPTLPFTLFNTPEKQPALSSINTAGDFMFVTYENGLVSKYQQSGSSFTELCTQPLGVDNPSPATTRAFLAGHFLIFYEIDSQSLYVVCGTGGGGSCAQPITPPANSGFLGCVPTPQVALFDQPSFSLMKVGEVSAPMIPAVGSVPESMRGVWGIVDFMGSRYAIITYHANPGFVASIDVTDPANPTLQDTLNVGQSPNECDFKPPRLYCGHNGHTVTITDISDPTNLVLTATETLAPASAVIQFFSAVAYEPTDFLFGARVGGNEGIVMFDITNSGVAGTIPQRTPGFLCVDPIAGCSFSDVEIKGTYLYGTEISRNRLVVYDLTTPVPTLVSDALDYSMTIGTLAHLHMHPTRDLAFVGAFGSNDLEIIDISDPTNPAMLQTLNIVGVRQPNFGSLQVVDDIIYVMSDGGDLSIIEEVNPNDFAITGVVDSKLRVSDSVETMLIMDGYLYVPSHDALTGSNPPNVFNVFVNGKAPTDAVTTSNGFSEINCAVELLGSSDHPFADADDDGNADLGVLTGIWALKDNRYAITTWNGQNNGPGTAPPGAVRVYDLIDPANPVLLPTSIATNRTQNGCQAQNDLLFCSNDDDVVHVVDFSDPTNLVLVGLVPGIDNEQMYDLALSNDGTALYQADPAGVGTLVYDVSNLAAPAYETVVCSGSGCATISVDVKGDFLYSANFELSPNVIEVYDISTPLAPIIVDTWTNIASSSFMHIKAHPTKDLLFISSFSSEIIQVLDISDPSAVSFSHNINLAFQNEPDYGSLHFIDDLVYVMSRDGFFHSLEDQVSSQYLVSCAYDTTYDYPFANSQPGISFVTDDFLLVPTFDAVGNSALMVFCSGNINNRCTSSFVEQTTPDCECLGLQCNSASGRCELITNGESCDDNDPCTQSSVCMEGMCTFNETLECTVPADDCKSNPVCSDGTCDYSANNGDLCMFNATETGFCIFGVCANPDTCDDGNPCTNDTLVIDPINGNSCMHAPINVGGPCDDGIFCTAVDQCQPDGQCAGHYRTDCPSDPCNLGFCNRDTDSCDIVQPMGNSCDTSDPCVDSACDGAGTCVTTPHDCSSLDTQCSQGVCNPVSGVCEVQASFVGSPCTPAVDDPCVLGSVCDAGGQCVTAASVDCVDPANACTAGATCDSNTGDCVYPAIGTACDDTVPCTENDACVNVVDAPPVCEGDLKLCLAPEGSCLQNGTCDTMTGVCNNAPLNCFDPMDSANVRVGLCDRGVIDLECNGGECVSSSAGECADDGVTCNGPEEVNPDTGVCQSMPVNCERGLMPNDECFVRYCEEGEACAFERSPLIGMPCQSPYVGACAAATWACDFMAPDTLRLVCINQHTITEEICDNGIDDNCDGRVDEYCTLIDCDDDSDCPAPTDECHTVRCGAYMFTPSHNEFKRPDKWADLRPGQMRQMDDDDFKCPPDATARICDLWDDDDARRFPGHCHYEPVTDLSTPCTPSSDLCFTGAGACAADGACLPTAPCNCDDGNEATADFVMGGVCVSQFIIGHPCDDGNACTVADQITDAAGTCLGTPVSCQVCNPCAATACVANSALDLGYECALSPRPAGTICDDNNPVTSMDQCDGNYVCAGTVPP